MKNLTDRETEILKLILNEASSIEIAEKLNVSVRTIDTHRRNILSKTGASNLIGLFKYAIKNNIIEVK